MNIAILSDSHDRWDKLEKAVTIAHEKKCEYLLFAGDLISPTMLSIFEKFTGHIHMVIGNNEGEIMKLTQLADKRSDKLTLHGAAAGNYMEVEIDGWKIFMQHYPKIGHHAALSQLYDLVVYGHDHLYHEEQVGKTLLLNPGEIQGYKTGISTCMILDTETKKVEKIIL